VGEFVGGAFVETGRGEDAIGGFVCGVFALEEVATG
jgi:hypothetical protein